MFDAGKPDPPANCTVTNQTSTSFSVACQAGFDGGLRQIFVLRVARPGTQGHNHTAGQPVFQVSQLQPDTTYRLQIWAVNDKGASPFVHLRAFTTHRRRTQTMWWQRSVRRQGLTTEVSAQVEARAKAAMAEALATLTPVSVFLCMKTVYLSSLSLLPEDVGDVPILVSAVVGASVGIVLLLLLLGLLLRQRVRRPQPPPTPQASHSVQVKSPVPILKRETHTCPEREMQVESESDADPDLIPQQLPSSALSPSGPLLRPPANYGGGDTSFCEVVPHGVVGGGGVLGGPGGCTPVDAGLPHQPAVSSSTSTPHHHQQSLLPQPQHAYQHDPTNDPRYAHLDLEHGSHHEAAVAAHRPRVVPTVYATLDTRHAHSRAHVTFDLRQAHSQASLDMARSHELPSCSQRGRALSRDLTPHTHESTTHDLSYGHQRSPQPHDPGRPLLDDDATPDTPLVGKRESSV
ncbi:putative nephrin-like isoform X3 [Penaeus vannamei]|uniref:Putative nephrin-like isoform X3 n=1 Tax=Penaeus vannamei TaxID=6689 RepID=A0A423UAD6_PENVA|nr:putative nephrin-like isoform X3 [Penaeus vannamei]